MSYRSVTFPATVELATELNRLAMEWGYKQHGYGGYTAFVADVLAAVVEKNNHASGEFDLNVLVSKKLPKK